MQFALAPRPRIAPGALRRAGFRVWLPEAMACGRSGRK